MARVHRIESREITLRRVRTRASGGLLAAFLSVFIVGLASPTRADVDLYLAPQFGISGLIADTDGDAPNITPLIFSGDDDDSSPLLGLAIGLEVPMNEIVPREWLADLRLPSWPVRFELEGSGLREYDLRTKGVAATEDFFTELMATTLYANVWLDVPMITIWRPFQYLFGLGRQPRVRSWLEPASFYLGSGIGMTHLDFDASDNTFRGKEEIIDFAWNVGAGFNYRLTERVTLSTGYRYLGLGASTGVQEIELGSSGPDGELEYDMQVHELRVALQIRVFSFRGAWR